MNTVAELLQNHVSLCVESLDRIYLNGYIPRMQVGEQLHAFLVYQRGAQVASPALLRQMNESFRRCV